jgi:hypothetical protein
MVVPADRSSQLCACVCVCVKALIVATVCVIDVETCDVTVCLDTFLLLHVSAQPPPSHSATHSGSAAVTASTPSGAIDRLAGLNTHGWVPAQTLVAGVSTTHNALHVADSSALLWAICDGQGQLAHTLTTLTTHHTAAKQTHTGEASHPTAAKQRHVRKCRGRL